MGLIHNRFSENLVNQTLKGIDKIVKDEQKILWRCDRCVKPFGLTLQIYYTLYDFIIFKKKFRRLA